VTPALLAAWGEVPAYADGLERLGERHTLAGLLEQLDAAAPAAIALARALFGRWLVEVVGAGEQAAA
jgi:hypothetical protein